MVDYTHILLAGQTGTVSILWLTHCQWINLRNMGKSITIQFIEGENMNKAKYIKTICIVYGICYVSVLCTNLKFSALSFSQIPFFSMTPWWATSKLRVTGTCILHDRYWSRHLLQSTYELNYNCNVINDHIESQLVLLIGTILILSPAKMCVHSYPYICVQIVLYCYESRDLSLVHSKVSVTWSSLLLDILAKELPWYKL